MAKTPAPPPSEKELEGLARHHINYEVLALIDAMGRGAAGAVPGPRVLADGVPHHALVSHDMLLHARLLANVVLCSDASCQHHDDVEARLYVPGWPGVNALGEDRTRVDKALAHLSRQRLGFGAISGPQRTAIATRVLQELIAFIEAVPDDRRPWFDQTAAAIRVALS